MDSNKILLFEGVDGCGKDTQIALLKEKMDFAHFKYPTHNFPILWEFLQKKRTLSEKALFHLFLADIAEEQEKLSSTAGLRVIDRYVLSTIAYDSHYSYEDAKRIVSASSFIAPDIVFLLDLPPEVAQERKMKQKQSEEVEPDRYDLDVARLSRVRERFLKLAGDSFLCKKWVVLDATKPIEGLHKEILSHLQ
ncbi:dTMP kinase [Candidatus Micrarchaeota archaeon]|nr:dTMP kinase [Candidatus Micrarchaeota archaeon]